MSRKGAPAQACRASVALVALAAALLCTPAGAAETRKQAPSIALVGATLVDLTHHGRGRADLADAVVLIANGRIVAYGKEGRLKIPKAARIVRLPGRFLIPGLIDGWGAIRSRGFAIAYLYEGVTSVYVPLTAPDRRADGEVRVVRFEGGPSVLTGFPLSGYSSDGNQPHAHDWVRHRERDVRLTRQALAAAVQRGARPGYAGVLIGRDVWPGQARIVVANAHDAGMFVAAEPAYTNYMQAVRSGVDLLLRNDSYELALASPPAWQAYARDPLGGGGRQAMQAVCGSENIDGATRQLGRLLAHSRTALMPVLVMEATADDIGGPNPWTLPGARFVSAGELDDPVDPQTGARPYLESHPDRAEAIRACARAKQEVDRQLHRLGAVYVAGTAAPAFGVIPGSGLHVEIKLLNQIGLTPREAIAAATTNFAEILRVQDRGLIAPGRRADLLVLRADPRKDVSALDQIETVVIGGKMIERSAIK